MVTKKWLTILFSVVLGMIAGCSNLSTNSQSATISVAIDWGVGGTPAAGTIDSIKITVASATATWFDVFAYSAHAGTVSNIPKNSSVVITIDGIKNPGLIKYHGQITVNNITDNMTVQVPAYILLSPAITTQPQSQTVTAGQRVKTSVTATGTSPLLYQWKKNNTDIAGAIADSLIIDNAQTANGGAYTVIITNSVGTIVSNAATLTVTVTAVAPSIATQPQAQAVMVGSGATFSVTANGTGPLAYQWKKDGTAISGATAANYAIATVTNGHAGTYSVVVTNSLSSVTSLDAVLTVTAAPIAPTIATQPLSQTITAGQAVTFAVVASGTAPFTYQWQKDNTAIAGATGSSYSIATVQNAHAGVYTVVVTNSVSSVTSNNATLTVVAAPVAPTITTQPQSQTVTAGQSVTFSVVASGTAPFTYQWKKSNTNVSGATSSSLFISSVLMADTGTYTIMVTNAVGGITSNGALLVVNAAPAIPVISTQPQAQTVTVGQSVTLSVVASGTAPLSYQWRKNGNIITGATAASFTIGTVAISDSGGYTVTVTNGAGNVVSSSARLTVNPAATIPVITTQPQAQTVTVGQSVTFSVVASGTAPLSYQWKKNGNAITGATAASYTIGTVAISDSGRYTVQVTNSSGNVTSNEAGLTVLVGGETVTDIDGNVYNKVVIGTQVWMVENLKTTKYNDGTAIPLVTNNSAWAALNTPGYCFYSNDEATNKSTYGTLYNWHAVNTGKLAPTGWHVPTDSEWNTLSIYLGGDGVAGGALKSPSILWLTPNVGATNSSGFSALPGGFRDSNGTFTYMGHNINWWSSTVANATNAWYRYLNYIDDDMHPYNYSKTRGKYIRCIQNYGTAPSFTAQPSNQVVTLGNASTFTIAATGSTPMGYQWQKNGADIPGANSPSYTTPATGSGENGAMFKCMVFNSGGSLMSNTATLTVNPNNASTVTDIDGNVYTSVTIGTQVWTVENLRVTRYNDSTAIPLVTDNAAWGALTTPGYCQYNNRTDADSIKKWGALYNWYVVDPANVKKIAPAGWHVPTDAEWTTMENYLIANGFNWDGTTTGNKIAKSLAAKTDWASYSTAGTIGMDLNINNRSGFSALPGGYCFNNGAFLFIGDNGGWWSAAAFGASSAGNRYLYYNYNYLYSGSSLKSCGFSVRLVRD